MGFLDDLKKQACAVRAEQEQRSSRSERSTMLADAACKTVLDYWLQLAEQLNTLKPVSAGRFAIGPRDGLQGLPMLEFRVDARRGGSNFNPGSFAYVVMHWTLRGPKAQASTTNFVKDMHRIEARLHQAGIKPVTDAMRSADHGKLTEVRYTYDAAIGCSMRATPIHDTGRVLFKLVNLDGLETVQASLAAHEIGAARLDELARWLLGEPHDFLRGAQDLQRSAPA